MGIMADKRNDKVPALVRLPNPEQRLRCREPVKVRFTHGAAVSGTK
jgi:hypothetical protein